LIDDQLPILQVVLPLLGALLAALFRRRNLAWLIALAVTWTGPVIAGRLLFLVLHGGTISYHIGGWAPEIGIEYRVDLLSAIFLLLVSSLAAVIVALAPRSVAKEIAPDRIEGFYAMLLLSLTGLLGIAITGDAFNAFVFLEVSSLSSYALIAFGKDRRALLSSYQYLIMGTIGATFYVIGVGIIYSQTGTLNLSLIAERIVDVESTRSVLAALAFIVVGISLKLALFPLHLWLPNAYAYAPSVATIFLASTATKLAVYLLIRYLYSVFGADFVFGQLPVTWILMALSVAAMFAASLVAVFQSNIKRMLAYSSVGQIGYITLGISIATVTGLTGGIVHTVNHALIKGAAFAAVAAIVFRTGKVRLEDLGGIGRKMPLTMAAFVVAGFGLIGVPGTAGFVSKWYLVTAAVDQGWWWLGLLIVASSLLALLYVGRVVEVAYFRAPQGPVAEAREAPPEMVIGAWLLAGAVIYFGLDPDLTAGLAHDAAAALLGQVP
jgi:multicomponent Na+:H+ antiporter subunit D